MQNEPEVWVTKENEKIPFIKWEVYQEEADWKVYTVVITRWEKSIRIESYGRDLIGSFMKSMRD